MKGLNEIDRTKVELVALIVIWSVPILCFVVLGVLKWRFGRYLKRKHPEKWNKLGGGGFFGGYALFGSFLFDRDDFLDDETVRRMKHGVMLVLLVALASTVLAFGLSVLSERYTSDLLGF